MPPSEPASQRRCRVLNDVTVNAGALADYAGRLCTRSVVWTAGRKEVCYRFLPVVTHDSVM